jgi:predicted TIM-barrel fold metal-dependent hydrolase
VLDDEGQVGEKGGRFINVSNIKGVTVKRPDRWAFMNMNVCNPKFYTFFQITHSLRICELVSFDVTDIDETATLFTDLTFIIEHCGLPRFDDFCWIAQQESNVWGGLAVVMPFIHTRPRYFAEVMANLLYWVGEDKLTFASDYAIWHPKWLVEKFIDFELPEDIKQEFGVDLTMEVKKKILGLNAAELYGIDIEAQKKKLENDGLALAA